MTTSRPFKIILTVVILALLALALQSVLFASASADGMTPLPDAVEYMGAQGGLYPGGANVPPADYAQAAYDTLAADDQVNVLCLGMSNLKHACDAFMAQAGETAVTIGNGGRPGQPQQAWDGGQTYHYTDLRRAGMDAADVDVVIYFNAWGFPDGDFVSHTAEMLASLRITVDTINATYPDLDLIYITSREYAPPGAAALNPNPYAYEEGFSVKWLIEERINNDIGGVPILWWAYQYDPTWPDSYYQSDKVHLSDAGLDVLGGLWVERASLEPWFEVVTPEPTPTPDPAATPTATPDGCGWDCQPTRTPRAYIPFAGGG